MVDKTQGHPPGYDRNGWYEWKKLIIYQLELQDRRMQELEAQLQQIGIALARLDVTLKLKSGVWGLIAGAIPVVVYLVIQRIS